MPRVCPTPILSDSQGEALPFPGRGQELGEAHLARRRWGSEPSLFPHTHTRPHGQRPLLRGPSVTADERTLTQRDLQGLSLAVRCTPVVSTSADDKCPSLECHAEQRPCPPSALCSPSHSSSLSRLLKSRSSSLRCTDRCSAVGRDCRLLTRAPADGISAASRPWRL